MGNDFGAWDPAKYEVEDSAFGFVRMKNGALINLRCSWALNMIAPGGSVLLCGTKGGLDNSDGVRANHVVANRQVDSKIATRAPRFMPSNLIDRNPMVMPQRCRGRDLGKRTVGQGRFIRHRRAGLYRHPDTGCDISIVGHRQDGSISTEVHHAKRTTAKAERLGQAKPDPVYSSFLDQRLHHRP